MLRVRGVTLEKVLERKFLAEKLSLAKCEGSLGAEIIRFVIVTSLQSDNALVIII